MRAWLIAIALLQGGTVWAGEWMQVTVTRVSDGDTVWVKREGGKPFKLRLQGIDAPERCQAWGLQSQAALASRVLRQQVQLEARAKDDYQRTLGNLYSLEGEDLSAWMVSQGHAWSYRYRRSAGPYADEEKRARAQQRGLFADAEAIEPRTFRQSHGPCH
jgi:micrococcal nuclease